MLLEKLKVWGQVADGAFQNGRDPYTWHRDNPEDGPASITCAEAAPNSYKAFAANKNWT